VWAVGCGVRGVGERGSPPSAEERGSRGAFNQEQPTNNQQPTTKNNQQPTTKNKQPTTKNK